MELQRVGSLSNMKSSDVFKQLMETFKNNVTIFMSFKNPATYLRYHKFVAQYNCSTITTAIIIAWYTITGSIFYFFAMYNTQARGSVGIIFLVLLLLTYVFTPLGFIIMYYRIFPNKHNKISPDSSSSSNNLKSWLIFLETIGVVTGSALMSAALFGQVYAGQCDSISSFNHILSCNPSANNYSLPSGTMLLTMMAPLVLSCVFRMVRWEAVLASYIISNVSILFCILYGQLYLSLYTWILYIPLSISILFENQRNSLVTFFLVERLEQLVVEVEKITKDTYNTEMIHMMANMAHDLKTV
jgi:hypothetical protein